MLRQILEISLMNLRNIPSRLGSSSVIVVGIAGVVGVLVGLLSMASGFTESLTSTGREDRALILRDGSNGELSSGLGPAELNIVSRLDGIEIAAGELYVVADVPKKSTGTPANLVVRGVQPASFDIRPEVQIVAGRDFQTGRGELIAGVRAAQQFAGLDIGDTISFRGDSQWTVVGHFSAGGSAYEGEVWADLPVAQAAFRRGGAMNSMRVKLADPALAGPLHDQIQADPRLDLALTTEAEFYQGQSAARAQLINAFGVTVAVIMAVGAIFAALNTMYSAVSARTVEIATLRALGFPGLPVVVSVILESMLLALCGGLLGGALVWFAFDGYTASTLNSASFSQVAFAFAVTPRLLLTGLMWALVLGLVGGLFPAVRAARLPITAALRDR
ncbi:MAG: FtsX-like permease family protein [Pseudomonadales bacterium]